MCPPPCSPATSRCRRPGEHRPHLLGTGPKEVSRTSGRQGGGHSTAASRPPLSQAVGGQRHHACVPHGARLSGPVRLPQVRRRLIWQRPDLACPLTTALARGLSWHACQYRAFWCGPDVPPCVLCAMPPGLCTSSASLGTQRHTRQVAQGTECQTLAGSLQVKSGSTEG